MYLSLKWLSELVDLDKNISPKEFSEKMTMSGSKVECFKDYNKIYKNIVVGKIIKIKQHENADKLVVCEVDVKNEVLQIVTGAKNIKENDIVPVALEEAILLNGLKIKKSKLRGVDSQGMLCSASELNLDIKFFEDQIDEGILILPNDFKIGENIAKALQMDDIIFEFEITSNRPDCLGVIGLSREVAATFNKPLKNYHFNIKNEVDDINNYISAEVNTNKCKRFILKVVKNVKVEESPNWLKNRLILFGINPINNIVDITNYILALYAQPMHAYDYDKIINKKIIVKDNENETLFKTLENKEINIPKQSVVINDDKNTLSLAGIIGGLDSSVTENTKTIVFEAAVFDSEIIQNTSRLVDVKTKSSNLFEKFVDVDNTINAINHACALIEELNCGEVIKNTIDIYKDKKEQKQIKLEPDFINKFLGTNISKNEMIDILNRLELKTENDIINIPSFRNDLFNKFDISEEIARIYGYNKIETVYCESSILSETDKKDKYRNIIKKVLCACGLNEIVTFSFLNPKDFDKINLNENSELRKNVIKIKNPIGETTSLMRTTLIPSLLNVINTNYKNKNEKGCFFEIAKEYHKNDDVLKIEKEKIIAGIYDKEKDFFDLKNYLEELLSFLKIKEYSFKENNNYEYFHPNKTADLIIKNEVCGTIGEIHPNVLENYDIKQKVYVFDIDFEKLYKNIKYEEIKYEQLPKFPSVNRDLGLICDREIKIGNIEKIIKTSSMDYLETIKLFDIYTGDKVEPNKKVVGFNLVFRSKNDTLSENEITNIIENILNELKKEDIHLRL